MTNEQLNTLHVLKPREVARLYRLSDATVYDALHGQNALGERVPRLPASRFGKTYRVRREDAEVWFLAYSTLPEQVQPEHGGAQ
ncbi:helix-turn-helix domain-containing protein [Deinococcus yavapaiensis]|uniref:Helix-turn-helix protein n=1 Tax=Deinococcus yavapaiensis KR-236 TaxID=694435 RepID=A0A318RZ10_9DEIO|nr:helix-turn-helix domain-containing protein [Deinococcus yavapaiensis]PYE48360.1 helix-turn-helix protein [Deinococcus yavapaiensis KR-236]